MRALVCDIYLPLFWPVPQSGAAVEHNFVGQHSADGVSNTMRKNLLNWCNLVSISKNVVFYAFLVVRIY